MGHPERRRIRADRGQSGAYQECARPQDRRERRDLDRGFGRLRADQGELCSGRGIQQLRSLLRGKQLSREQISHIQRIQKTLEAANIKLDSVISDIMGVSGRRMIEAMMGGVRNPHKLAALADRRIKASPKVLYDALHGRLTDHHRLMLELYLGQHDALGEAIAKIDAAVDVRHCADGRGGADRSG